jgi:hypothetical protein
MYALLEGFAGRALKDEADVAMLMNFADGKVRQLALSMGMV